jgi:hypothetical protein
MASRPQMKVSHLPTLPSPTWSRRAAGASSAHCGSGGTWKRASTPQSRQAMTHWWITPLSSRARWPPPGSSASSLASGPVRRGGAVVQFWRRGGVPHADGSPLCQCPQDPPASEARGGPTPDCSSACPPRSLCVVLPLTVRGGRQRVLNLRISLHLHQKSGNEPLQCPL